MPRISFDITDEKLKKFETAMAGLYPIPSVNNGTEEEPDMRPKFTDSQWAKECLRRWVVRQVARYEQKTAIDAIAYSEDNDLLS